MSRGSLREHGGSFYVGMFRTMYSRIQMFRGGYFRYTVCVCGGVLVGGGSVCLFGVRCGIFW